MKTKIAITLLASGWFALPALAQQKAEPQFKLVQFQLAIFKTGPKAGAMTTAAVAKLSQEHVKYVTTLIGAGKVISAGHFTDNGDVRGICIFRVATPAEAEALAEKDPTVSAGLLSTEIHPWWAEDILRQPDTPLKFEQLYFCFLSRGPHWTPEKTAAIAELQKAHLANIARLAGLKKLLLAGPFGDGGNLAGIFVFRVASLAEAQSLTETDPMIQSGRLIADLHPWMVPEGIFPRASIETQK